MSSAEAEPAPAHWTIMVAGYRVEFGRTPAVTSTQLWPPSEVRYSRPPAPSQPLRGSLKHTVWAFAGERRTCQLRPPLLVVSTTPATSGASAVISTTATPPA